MRPHIDDVGDAALVVRTDYSDDDAWRTAVAEVHANLLIANCDFPDPAAQAQEDPDAYYRGLTANEKATPALTVYRDALHQQMR